MQENNFEKEQVGITPNTPKAIKFLAQFLSYIFHPVFLPLYFVYFLVYLHPFKFLGFTPIMKLFVMLQAFAMYFFFPMVTVGLLKALKFIDSIHLYDRKDRIIPLVACGIWYFWIWYVWRNVPDYPSTIVHMALGIWMAASVALFINAFMKVSLHGLSLGGLLMLLIQLSLTESVHYGWYLSIGILITGAVSTARLLVSDHRPAEVYVGLLTGAVTMFLTGFFV